MNRSRHATALLALGVVPAVLALGACAGRAGAGEPAGQDAIATWSGPAGIAPELVYVTDVDGFELATQSVGVMGDDGMSAAYTRTDGDALAIVMLTTSRQPDPGAGACADLPDSSEPEPTLVCVVDRAGVHVTLAGEGVDATTLRAASEAVRVPSEGELEHLFTDVQVAGVPVERGDLPPGWDGAPIDEVGPGG